MAGWRHEWRSDWRHDWRGVAGDSSTVPGSGPEGSGSFALDLNSGYTLTWRWPTDVIKSKSGKEQRIPPKDRPKESIAGTVLLFGRSPADLRSQLARTASGGEPVLLGLPHEELTFAAPASGTTVYVSRTDLSDWMNPGQRVLVKRGREQMDAVIQSTAADSIELDVDPGALGLLGGRIMPALAMYLEPEQAFPRYPVNAESWEIRARAAVFDFARELAALALGPLTSSPGLTDATVTARYPGASPTIALLGGGIGSGQIHETPDFILIEVEFGVTTVEDLYALFQSSTVVNPTGTWGSGTLGVMDMIFSGVLSGGALAGPVGTGATIATYAGHPVWDRALENDDTITDSVHAMTEILDFGGVPYAIGSADQPDWGRTLNYSGSSLADWQWLKLFMATVRGSQKVFWLSTHRDDMPCVATGTGTLTLAGDLSAWWPSRRQHVEVRHAGGVSRHEITAATNNGDGTWTVTIGATLSGVEVVSWLELCRFEGADFGVTFDGDGFSMTTVARGVQQ
jgi:hypothetical protein